MTTPLLGFAGFSGSGKTTLLERVITQLKQHGLRIALIKHSHHDIEPDKPGKDSYRLRHAGACQTLLATRGRHMLYFEYPEPREEPSLAQCVAQLDHSQLDVILVEGFRDEAIAKIEVHRPSYGKPRLHLTDAHIIAVASDVDLADCALPQLDLNQPDTVTAFIVSWLAAETKASSLPHCVSMRK